MKIVLILGVLALVFNLETAGLVGTRLYDFKNFNSVNFAFLDSEVDLHAKINREGIEDFVYMIGGSTFTNCTQESFACIKYIGDPKYYAVTSEKEIVEDSLKSHHTSFDELEAAFTIQLPKSNEKLESGEAKREVQLLMKFKCTNFKKVQSSLSEIEPFTYLLEILSSDLCPQRFDYISYVMHKLRYFLGFVLIIMNIFLLIPYPYEKKNKDANAKKNEDANESLYVNCLGLQIGIIASITVSFALNEYLSLFLFYKILIISLSFAFSFSIPYLFIIKLGQKNWVQHLVCFFSAMAIISLIINFILVPFMNNHKRFHDHINYVIILVIIVIICSSLFEWKKADTLREFFKMFFHVFMLVRGFAVFIGGYPNELIIELMKEAHIKFPKIVYCYLIPILIYPIFAFIFTDSSLFNKLRSHNPLFSQKVSKILDKSKSKFVDLTSSFGPTNDAPEKTPQHPKIS